MSTSSAPRNYVCRTATAALSLILLTSCGCMSGLLQMPAGGLLPKLPDIPKLPGMGKEAKRAQLEEDNDFETRVETPLLGEYISVQGNNLVTLRGVGLVTGLDGTGGDPPPSPLRTELLDEMGRRGIPKPNEVLKSRNTALVIVTAMLPAMVREDQPFDVRVALPPNSDASSLKGGWLLETRLHEEQVVAQRGALRGHEYGVAYGAIVTAFGVDSASESKVALLRRGSIPGGARSKTSRDLEVVLRNGARSLRNSKRIATAISDRFHHYNQWGQRESLADAQTDVLIELKVHPTYRNNFPRYQQVIRSIAFKETDVARRMRMELLASQILQPETARSAALQLEAVGHDGIQFLKPALEADDLEVRFYAAEALAYLEDSSGVDVLKQAVIDEPAFRVYGLAALSVITDANGILALRELLGVESLETRYGALRALKEAAPNDPSLGTETFPRQFILHQVASDSVPMVHVTRRRAPEISIFGTQQKLMFPAVLSAGRKIRVIGRAGESTVTLTKYELNAEPVRKTCSNRLTDIIRMVGEMGATYPDVVQMLIEANQQQNLEGEFGIDKLPQAGRTYIRADRSSGEAKRRKLGSESLIPGLFDRVEDTESEQSAADEVPMTVGSFSAVDPSDTNRSSIVARTADSSSAEGSLPDTGHAGNLMAGGATPDSARMDPEPTFAGLTEPVPSGESFPHAESQQSESETTQVPAAEDVPKTGFWSSVLRNPFRS